MTMAGNWRDAVPLKRGQKSGEIPRLPVYRSFRKSLPPNKEQKCPNNVQLPVSYLMRRDESATLTGPGFRTAWTKTPDRPGKCR